MAFFAQPIAYFIAAYFIADVDIADYLAYLKDEKTYRIH